MRDGQPTSSDVLAQPFTANLNSTSQLLSAGRHLVCDSTYVSLFSANGFIEDSVALFGSDHEFTKLIINHKGVDPEDAFSTIPYEKGFHFLYYLDRLVGREHFDKFIPHYFKTWANKSLDSFEFKKTFLDFFESYGNSEIKEKIASIPWDEKFYEPGLPPKPVFNTAYVDSCLALAKKWENEVSDFALPNT